MLLNESYEGISESIQSHQHLRREIVIEMHHFLQYYKAKLVELINANYAKIVPMEHYFCNRNAKHRNAFNGIRNNKGNRR